MTASSLIGFLVQTSAMTSQDRNSATAEKEGRMAWREGGREGGKEGIDAAQARTAWRCVSVRNFNDAYRHNVFVATPSPHSRSITSWDRNVDNAATCRQISELAC